MGFFDLNIPYHESDRHAVDKPSLKGRRLKLGLKAMELGYTGVAYNRTLKGVMSESDRCATTLFPLSKLAPSTSSSFFASVKFHRELLNVAVSAPFRQYTRLTVVVDIPSQASALNGSNPVLKSYDIIAVRPMNQNAFDQACQTSEVDMIAIDFSEKLPFRLKQPMVKAAIKRGVYFEITYSGLIADVQSRRQMISNCKLLVDWTQGKNLILCSAAPSATELRGPQDVTNLFSLLGLPRERAKAAISKNCRSLLANALRKKHFYKEAVKVEQIPSGGQVNPAQSAFDDWLKWDPISSGEGDLLLDDMEKSFAISKTVKENMKSINFTSNINGLPAHGLQIKDLICATKAALEPLDTDNGEVAAMEIERDAADKSPEEQGGLNVLHEEQSSVPENQCGHSNLSQGQEGVVLLPEGHGQASVDHAKNKHQISEFEDSGMLCLPTCNGESTNSEDTIPVSDEKLKYSNGLEANLVTSETLLKEIPSPVNGGSPLHDGGHIHITDTLINNNHVSLEFSNPLATIIAVDKVSEKIDIENTEGQPLASSDTFSQDVDVEGGRYSKMTDSSIKLADGLPVGGFLSLTTDFSEPIKYDVMGEQKQIDSVTNYQNLGKFQAGRERRKRNSSHQPFLFPFKRFLKPSPFKRKSRK